MRSVLTGFRQCDAGKKQAAERMWIDLLLYQCLLMEKTEEKNDWIPLVLYTFGFFFLVGWNRHMVFTNFYEQCASSVDILWTSQLGIFQLTVCVCVCVCVWHRERMTVRESLKMYLIWIFFLTGSSLSPLRRVLNPKFLSLSVGLPLLLGWLSSSGHIQAAFHSVH